MASFNLTISAGDLATLRDVPRQIESLATTAKQVLEGARSGASSGNPVGALFAGLETLGGEAARLPAIEPVLAPLRELAGRLPASALADAQAIGAEIDKVLALFGPLKDDLLSGKVDRDLGAFAEKTIGELGNLFKPGDEFTSLFRELETLLQLFKAVLGWANRAPPVADVVAVLSRGLAGMPTDLLAGPQAALEAALAPLAQLLPEGADLARWRAIAAERAAFWADVKLRATGTVDWRALEARLHAEGAALIEIGAARDRLFQACVGNVARLDLSRVGAVGAAVVAVPKPSDFRLAPLLDDLRRHLQSVVTNLESWAPNEAEVRVFVRGLADELVRCIEASPLGEIRTQLVNFQQRVLNAVEDLPLRGIALKAENALRDLAASIDVIDPDTVKRPVHELFGKVETKLDELAGHGVADAVGALWAEVGDAVRQIVGEVETLRTTLDSLTAQLTALPGNVKPALQAITDAVAQLDATLGEFDLHPPAQVVIDELNGLRDRVAALDLSSLPGAAVGALKVAAEALRKLDFTGTISPPLDDALGKVDPSALIREAADKIGGVTAQLKMIDPATLAGALDRPVDELLAELERLGPEQFQRLLQAALRPIEDAIRGLDFSALLAPITGLYAELTAKVDTLLNPDAIFAPLEKLFQPIIDVATALEPTRFIGLIEPHAGGMAQGVSKAGGPPASIAAAGFAALPVSAEAAEPLFGFRIGDLLIPLIDLHRQLTRTFDALDAATLTAAGAAVRAALQGPLEALDPLAIGARVDASFDGVAFELDPAQVAARLNDAVSAFHDAADAVATAAAVPPQGDDVVISVRVVGLLDSLNPLALVPDAVQFDALLGASLQARANVDLTPLTAALPALAYVQKLVPEFLRAPVVTADTIRQALRDLDPAPLRVELNEIFDRIGRRVVALQDIVGAAFEEVGKIIDELLLPVSPSALLRLAARLHAALLEQLLAFSPARFKDEVALIFGVVKSQLGAFDPVVIVQELEGLRDALAAKVAGLAVGLAPDGAPFRGLEAELAELKPSRLLAPLVVTLRPVSEIVAKLDVRVLFEPLLAAIQRVRDQVPEVIAEIEVALDEVLAAFPEGGADSGGVSASASVSVG